MSVSIEPQPPTLTLAVGESGESQRVYSLQDVCHSRVAAVASSLIHGSICLRAATFGVEQNLPLKLETVGA